MLTAVPTIEELRKAVNKRRAALPEEFLNAYKITNFNNIEWDVSIYRAERKNNRPTSHIERGEIKNALWSYYFKNKAKCRGYKFVADINEVTVVVPSSWQVPEIFSEGDFNISLVETRTVKLSKADRKISEAILREGIKSIFKFNRGANGELGELWQDFGKFCQAPVANADDDFCVSRRFNASVKVFPGDNWLVKCAIGTTLIDSLTFADYYREGRVNELAESIKIKRMNGMNRQNQPVNVRVLHYNDAPESFTMEALELDNPDLIIQHATWNRTKQADYQNESIGCRAFKREANQIPLSEIRLILNSQITGDDHTETIIDPADREPLMKRIRDFINGAEIFGQVIRLDEKPFDTDMFERGFVLPPSIRVRSANGATEIIPAPQNESEEEIKNRARKRSQHIRQHGFLIQRPINPLIAVPHHAEETTARRLTNDLNYILQSQNVDFRFQYLRYKNVEEIRREINQNDYDALLAVLPLPQDKHDVYNQIKERVEVPSQCIELRNTLPWRFVGIPYKDLVKSQSKLVRRIRQRYEMCILNLLVKHHWLPFIPTSSFHYNLQAGLDVGGIHNTDAVSCFGYGFGNPEDILIFRPERIPIETQKGEPIPTKSLYEGLLTQFEILKTELDAAGKPVDFETALFYRDGQLLGDGDSWNEREALIMLHEELLRREWISTNSVWTAVEVMKQAEDWRIFRGEGETASRPLGGRYLYPFDEKNSALVLTTGNQHLTQGTPCPLRVRIVDIFGESNAHAVIQDLIWQADLSFTKPDVGMRLPWVLHVADAGALQQSRSYKITGITA
jgi:hypothetical protein